MALTITASLFVNAALPGTSAPYAATQPMEDFAENFMHFVKHRGDLPAKWQTRHIEKRWGFIHCLASKI